MVIEVKGMMFDTLDVDDMAEVLRMKANNIKLKLPPQVFTDCAEMLDQLVRKIDWSKGE